MLNMLPEITRTCRACREWAKQGPSNASNVEIAIAFNAQVEYDLLVIHKYIIFRMIDRCTRWHAAKLIPGKLETTRAKAIDELWVSTNGAPKELILDGASLGPNTRTGTSHRNAFACTSQGRTSAPAS